jgi:hypothetical protein
MACVESALFDIKIFFLSVVEVQLRGPAMEEIELRAIFRRSVGVLGILVFAGFLASLGACRMPGSGQPSLGAKQNGIQISAEQITLEWDPPASTVSSYEVYFRMHGTENWQIIGSTSEVSQPKYTILHSDVGNGDFDFAVVAVDSIAARSDYHTSLDDTARPDTGWYLIWRR